MSRYPAAVSRLPPIPYGKYISPLKTSYRVTSHFQTHETDDRLHLGIDLSGRLNTPVYAAQSGRVVYAGSGFSGYGKMVLIADQDGWASLYAHLNRINVKTGQSIVQGRKIGLMGSTGRSTGVHLHFEMRKDKIPLDPYDILTSSAGLPRKITLNDVGPWRSW